MSHQRSTAGTAVEPSAAHVSFYVSVVDAERARDVLGNLTDCLGEADRYTVRWAEDVQSDPVFCTNAPVANHVTEPQLRAARLAVERGYYDRPKRVSLDTIADELDVSPSEVSRRLGEVERRLVSALVEYRG